MDPFAKIDEMRSVWTDRYVTVKDRPELRRFNGIVGRVVTVNCNGKAVIDFQDGGWYDITASEEFLAVVASEEGAAKYKNVNSAQPLPAKGG